MDSIKDIIGSAKFKQPPEIEVIKHFVNIHFHAIPQVTVQDKQIIIGVSGAALAGSLRMRLHELQKLCGTSKRLVIRIS